MSAYTFFLRRNPVCEVRSPASSLSALPSQSMPVTAQVPDAQSFMMLCSLAKTIKSSSQSGGHLHVAPGMDDFDQGLGGAGLEDIYLRKDLNPELIRVIINHSATSGKVSWFSNTPLSSKSFPASSNSMWAGHSLKSAIWR